MHVRFSQFDLLYVCFCKEEDYFESIYPNTANSWSEILLQYALCITPNACYILSVKCSFPSPFLFLCSAELHTTCEQKRVTTKL